MLGKKGGSICDRANSERLMLRSCSPYRVPWWYCISWDSLPVPASVSLSTAFLKPWRDVSSLNDEVGGQGAGHWGQSSSYDGWSWCPSGVVTEEPSVQLLGSPQGDWVLLAPTASAGLRVSSLPFCLHAFFFTNPYLSIRFGSPKNNSCVKKNKHISLLRNFPVPLTC